MFAPFGPASLTPGLGMALVFVVSAFLGFEATAIFGEEARDPGAPSRARPNRGRR